MVSDPRAANTHSFTQIKIVLTQNILECSRESVLSPTSAYLKVWY